MYDLPDPGAVGGHGSSHRGLEDVRAVSGAERQDPSHLAFVTHQGPSRVTLSEVRDTQVSPCACRWGWGSGLGKKGRSGGLGGAGGPCKPRVHPCYPVSSFPWVPLLWTQVTSLVLEFKPQLSGFLTSNLDSVFSLPGP